MSPSQPDARFAPGPPRAAVIAVVGCDGAGKSTLTTDLVQRLHDEVPIEYHYLGQSSGNIARAIQSLPLVGKPIKAFLVRKADRAHDTKSHAAGAATALVIYTLSRWRAYKFRRMLARCRGGVVAVADRYPQAEVPGFHFDGPGLPALRTRGWLARTLAERETRLYRRMAAELPDLVIRLNIDFDTAFARKPDHNVQALRGKVEVIPGLRFNGAHTIDLDGRTSYEQVLATALREARAAIERRRV